MGSVPFTRWCIQKISTIRPQDHTVCNVQLIATETGRQMKWNESGFRPLLCTYRLNWARRTSWGWWGDWDDTVLQTQDSKFEPWRSEAEHATSRSRRLPTILTNWQTKVSSNISCLGGEGVGSHLSVFYIAVQIPVFLIFDMVVQNKKSGILSLYLAWLVNAQHKN